MLDELELTRSVGTAILDWMALISVIGIGISLCISLLLISACTLFISIQAVLDKIRGGF